MEGPQLHVKKVLAPWDPGPPDTKGKEIVFDMVGENPFVMISSTSDLISQKLMYLAGSNTQSSLNVKAKITSIHSRKTVHHIQSPHIRKSSVLLCQ